MASLVSARIVAIVLLSLLVCGPVMAEISVSGYDSNVQYVLCRSTGIGWNRDLIEKSAYTASNEGDPAVPSACKQVQGGFHDSSYFDTSILSENNGDYYLHVRGFIHQSGSDDEYTMSLCSVSVLNGTLKDCACKH